MTSSTYIYLPGTLAEAFALYAAVLGGTLRGALKYSQVPPNPGMPMPPGFEDKLANASLEAHGLHLMGSDVPPAHYVPMLGVDLVLGVDTPEEAERIFAAFAEGGTITQPMAETFWAQRFGKCKDRFGVAWMINCYKPAPTAM
jgi:PhnB protein